MTFTSTKLIFTIFKKLLKDIHFKFEGIMAKPKDKLNKRHIGRNVQRIRMYCGMKQGALAADLGISQQEVSKIERQSVIEEHMLLKIANILGLSAEVIRNFDAEKVIDNINNSYKDATVSKSGNPITSQVNPTEKIIELYKRLLQSEREKVELLKNR